LVKKSKIKIVFNGISFFFKNQNGKKYIQKSKIFSLVKKPKCILLL